MRLARVSGLPPRRGHRTPCPGHGEDIGTKAIEKQVAPTCVADAPCLALSLDPACTVDVERMCLAAACPAMLAPRASASMRGVPTCASLGSRRALSRDPGAVSLRLLKFAVEDAWVCRA